MADLLLLVVFALVFLSLIFLRFEIGFAIGTLAYSWLAFTGQTRVAGTSRIFGTMDLFVLLALPFFLLAGELMTKSEITGRLVDVANLSIGRVRGGLAQANVGASLLFSGITGAAVADVAALGTIFIPAMEQEGYDRDFSAAVTAASSLIGPIIPPSIIIVVFGGITNISVGGLFAAAIIPGIILGLSLMFLVFLLARLNDYPRHVPDISRDEYPKLAFDSMIAMTMPAIILFGILWGIYTPTEAAAIASVYAAFVGVFVFRTLTVRRTYDALSVTVWRSGQLFIIIGMTGILSWILAREGVPGLIAQAAQTYELGTVGFMIVACFGLLFIGTWLNVGAAIIIIAPTLMEVASQLGIHEFHFGIVMVVTMNIGLITPPIGLCLFVAASVAERPVWPIARQLVPFFVVDMVVILLLILFPELTLYIPRVTGFI